MVINTRYVYEKMIFHYMKAHWKHRQKKNGLLDMIASIFNLSRVLFFFAEHCKLFQLEIYRNYAAISTPNDLFYHLSHRYYLAKNLSVPQRIRCVLSHYHFENATYDSTYKHMIYIDRGLTLWANTVNGINFVIKILKGSREGELCITLCADQERLYNINFTWINSDDFDLHRHIIPFITRNQGRNQKVPELYQRFENAFPQNSPIFFCLAAMQGVARAVGATQMIGVNYANQIYYKANSIDALTHFLNSYDVFWESVGGVKLPTGAYLIPVPFHIKPLSEVSAKHRKRAARRRAHWQEIDESAHVAIQAHMIQ